MSIINSEDRSPKLCRPLAKTSCSYCLHIYHISLIFLLSTSDDYISVFSLKPPVCSLSDDGLISFHLEEQGHQKGFFNMLPFPHLPTCLLPHCYWWISLSSSTSQTFHWCIGFFPSHILKDIGSQVSPFPSEQWLSPLNHSHQHENAMFLSFILKKKSLVELTTSSSKCFFQ